METEVTIKDRVRKLCESRGITIAQLEKELGFGNGTIARWNVSKPRINKLSAVATYFTVPVQSLTGEPMPGEKENPATASSNGELEDAIQRGKKAYFNDLFDRASPELQDKAISILLGQSHNQ